MIELQESNKKILFQNLKELNCTCHSYGYEKIYQETYYCIKCDEEKIEPVCSSCIKICHSNCEDSNHVELQTKRQPNYN